MYNGGVPSSTAVLKVHGDTHPGRHTEQAKIEKVRLGRPEKPTGYKPEYDRYWDEIIIRLESLETLTVDHGLAIMALCQALVFYDKIADLIDLEGVTIPYKAGTKVNPLLQQLNYADARRRVWMNELGLNPLAWARVQKSTVRAVSTEAEDPFAELSLQ